MSSKRYQAYLRQSGGGKFRFPVLPDKVSKTNKSLNDTLEVAGKGEITIIQGKSEMVVTFSSFFPNHYFQGASSHSIPKAKNCVKKIENMKKSKKPVRFTFTGALNISMYCTIEQFDPYEQGGDVGTVYYSIKLKEYQKAGVTKITVDSSASTATVSGTDARTDNSSAPQTYTVGSGDCLWNIAKKIYGDGSKYTKIYEANKAAIGSNPNLINDGLVLSIPAA